MIGNRVVINRGDSWDLTIKVLDEAGELYYLEDGDTLYFGVMDPHQHFEDALIRKKLTNKDSNYSPSTGLGIFKLKASDTIDLIPGIYYYAVKLHRVNKTLKIDEVITVIDKTKFVIND